MYIYICQFVHNICKMHKMHICIIFPNNVNILRVCWNLLTGNETSCAVVFGREKKLKIYSTAIVLRQKFATGCDEECCHKVVKCCQMLDMLSYVRNVVICWKYCQMLSNMVKMLSKCCQMLEMLSKC